MKWLLGIFPAYVALVRENAELEALTNLLTARNEELEEKLNAVNEEHKADMRERTEDAKKTADAFSRQATGRNVYAKSEAPVAQAVNMPQPQRIFARDEVARRTREAYAAAHKARGLEPQERNELLEAFDAEEKEAAKSA